MSEERKLEKWTIFYKSWKRWSVSSYTDQLSANQIAGKQVCISYNIIHSKTESRDLIGLSKVCINPYEPLKSRIDVRLNNNYNLGLFWKTNLREVWYDNCRVLIHRRFTTGLPITYRELMEDFPQKNFYTIMLSSTNCLFHTENIRTYIFVWTSFHLAHTSNLRSEWTSQLVIRA